MTTKTPKRQPTTDAIEILHRRYYEGRPDRLKELEEARVEDEIARKIYALRTEAGLTQRALAKLVGTSASVIDQLEDADYEGHSMAMLKRIAEALHKRMEIRFVSIRDPKNKSSDDRATVQGQPLWLPSDSDGRAQGPLRLLLTRDRKTNRRKTIFISPSREA
ncbi:MAG: helix-turn-helix transcriptional regulator [Deltaproteobacteria bacterium]|nr:helix-turn-helix transcriptional regulator [Deltaproteobacteria bacterium]